MPAGWPEGYQVKRMAHQRVSEAKASGIELDLSDAILQIIGEVLAGAEQKGISPQEALTGATMAPAAPGALPAARPAPLPAPPAPSPMAAPVGVPSPAGVMPPGVRPNPGASTY